MSWIESHQSLINHPKLLKLSSLTGYDLDKCIAKLHRLWWWALDYAEDGDLRRFTSEEIGLGIQISDANDAKRFYAGLIGSDFIDEKTLYIHDWLDYAGRYLKSKYHTNNPAKYEKILKKHSGKPKGKPVGKLKGELPTNLNLPNQPNLPKDTRRTVKDPRAAGPSKTLASQKPSSSLTNSAGAKQFFDQFWAAYPKHRARAEAEKAFLKIHPDEPLLARMLSSIERARTSDDWKNQNGRYIPHAATWLNGKRWEDEFDGRQNGVGTKYAGIGVTIEAED